MMTRHTRGTTTWVDLESPTHEELSVVMKEFGINSRIEEEIVSPTPYPISIGFPDYEYMVLHFPTASNTDGARSQEVDFIVGTTFLVTVRYEVVEPLHSLHRVFEADELLGYPDSHHSPEALVEQVLRRLYSSVTAEAEQLLRILERIELDIFSGRERQTVRSISNVNRVLLRFETMLARHEGPLTGFLERICGPAFFGKRTSERCTRIAAERSHAMALVTSYRAVASELRVTNDSLLSASQNGVMKTLTIMAFVTFPLTLISSIFGMNTSYLPVVGIPGDFWYVIAGMVLMASSFFIFFRLKRWL